MLKKYFTREVKIGLLAVTATALLFYGLNFLKGVNVFKPTNYYYASYSDIDGLVETSPVFIKGHQVGQVREISYDFSKESSFVITLDIAKDLYLPEGSMVELFDNGLIGGKAVRIVYAEQSGIFEPVGDTLNTSVSVGLMKYITEDLVPQIDSLVSAADSLITSVRNLAEGEQLNNSLASIENMTANLEQGSSQLKVVMGKDVPKIVKDINVITGDLTSVSQNLKGVDFAKTVSNIDSTMANLNAITESMNSKDGSLGLLINDKALYNNLKHTSDNANKLVVDINKNPRRYIHFSVFGKSEKKK